jgi:SAM-dependent methyltransferase
MPHGTARDNSQNPLFNQKLWLLFPNRKVSVLDIGCSGGGFVKSCVDQGYEAIGLEGSDYSQKTGRAEWGTIPERLFTCDATTDFSLFVTDPGLGLRQPARFDVITAWEFIEHIAEADLPAVCRNVDRHLIFDGLWAMSVSPNEEIINGVRLHQTVRERNWWLDFFRDQGWTNRDELVGYFGNDWVRGPFQNAPESFHVVLMRKDAPSPKLPRWRETAGLNVRSSLATNYQRARSIWHLVRGRLAH